MNQVAIGLRQHGIRLSRMLRAAALVIVTIAAGCLIAAMDLRPGWDDTGVTAGALFVASALASVLGVPWWLAPVLVAGPLMIAEAGGLGWGVMVVAGISLAGAAVGAAARRILRPASA